MVQRAESSEQASVFEAYYAMGAGGGKDRSLAKLHQYLITSKSKTQPSLRTLQNWSAWFAWQERVAIKDKSIAEGVDKKTTRESVNLRAKWLAQSQVRIDTAFDEKGNPKFGIEGYKDLIDSVKLALTLLGEPERKEVEHVHEHKIEIIEVKETKRKD